MRHGLHVHHLEHRSKFGKKKSSEMNDPSNLAVLCWFHHRMLHAVVIGMTGKAPHQIEWRRPMMMETATERDERLAAIDVTCFDDVDLEPAEPLPAKRLANLHPAMDPRATCVEPFRPRDGV